MKFIDAKKKYKSLYIIEFSKEEAVMFRPLLYSEFKAYRALITSRPSLELDAKIEIYEECVIESCYPKDLSKVPAGVIETIADFILKISGPMSQAQIYTDLSEVRDVNLVVPELRFLAMVSSYFGINSSDMDDMTWDEILGLLAQTELLIEGRIPAAPFRPYVPEESEEQIDFQKENRAEAEL